MYDVDPVDIIGEFGTLLSKPLTDEQIDIVVKDLIADKAVKINKIKNSRLLSKCRCNYCSVYDDFNRF